MYKLWELTLLQLKEALQNGLEFHEDLQQLAIQQGLKGKKLNKGMENFVWNVRVLKGQADLILHAAHEAKEYIVQVSQIIQYYQNIVWNSETLLQVAEDWL